MELLQLKQETNSGKLRKFYIFFGEEYYVLNEFVKKVARLSGKPIKYINTIGEVTKFLNNKNLFGASYTYVCSDDKDVLSSEYLWPALRENKSDNVIILKFTNLDKRSKFYKENVAFATEFEKLGGEIMIKHAMKDYGLTQSNATRLVNRCDENYGLMVLCGEKINLLAKISNVNTDRAFELCVRDGLIPITSTDLGIEFSDCVIQGDIPRSFMLKDLILEGGESVLQLIALLYTGFRNVFLVQSCSKNDDITQKTGLNSFLVGVTKPKCGVYKTASILGALRFLRDAEVGLKNGLLSEEYVLDDFLINFFFQEIV